MLESDTTVVIFSWEMTSCASHLISDSMYWLNKYQINMGFCISMESGITISVPYQIDVVKWCSFSYRFFHLFYIHFSFTNKSYFWKMETTSIRYLIFCTFQKKYIKNLVELPVNKTFDLKFSCSTGDEWNLVYNKINNCIPINQ